MKSKKFITLGESTRAEIAYAMEQGKPVRRLSEEHPGWTEGDCRFWLKRSEQATRSPPEGDKT